MDLHCDAGGLHTSPDIASRSTTIPRTTTQRQTVKHARKLHIAHTIHESETATEDTCRISRRN